MAAACMASVCTDALHDDVRDILVAERNTDWVYSLFPSLLHWRTKGCNIRVLLPISDKNHAESQYQRRLLKSLGVFVYEVGNVPVLAWLMNPTDLYSPRAVVGIPKTGTHSKMEAIKYEGILDSPVIRALNAQIEALLPPLTSASTGVTIAATSADKLLKRLRTLPQYSRNGVRLSIETVPISRLVSLTKYVREYKSRQIGYLVKLYQESNIDLFQPAVVNLASGQQSIITPPVLEESGNELLIIEGSTRAVYCRDHGIERFAAVVVRNVTDPLPSAKVDFSRVRIVSKTLDPNQRYPDFSYSNFRHIESSVHPLDSLDE
ncbi:hypothetical protein EON65_57095 [archaeon]|nr:MAG: hypothetical protein EON65_57095 [archaeon]